MTAQSVSIGAFCSPVAGETVSGDQAAHWSCKHGVWLTCLIDGLGHGRQAHHAAMACLEGIARCREAGLDDIIRACNDAIRGTRGVAVSLARINASAQQLSYAGVGNISACLVSGKVRRMVNCHGIVGDEQGFDIPVQNYEFVVGRDRFVMTSDGVDECVDYGRFPFARHDCPAHLARTLVTEHRTGRDDASALVVL